MALIGKAVAETPALWEAQAGGSLELRSSPAARPSPIAHAYAPAARRHAGLSGYSMHIYGRGAKQKSGNRMDAALKVVSPRIELGSNL